MLNISNLSSSNNELEVEPHRFIGVLYIIHGSVYLVLLIPCLLVIAQKEQLQHSCYKIMLVMTILDIINLVTASLLSGYYSYNAILYCCGNELSMQIAGRLALGVFFMYCAICVLLAFNRFIDFFSDKLTDRLFGQRRTWYWFIVPFLYGAYFFTPGSTTIIYNSQLDIWMFTLDSVGRRGVFIHTINNVSTAVALLVLYTVVCFIIYNRFKKEANNTAAGRHMSTMQIQVIIQSMLICFVTVVACFAYVIAQHNHFPLALYKLTQIIWQIMHGISGIIYLTFNKTIRKKVEKMIIWKKNQVTLLSPSRSHQ